MKRKADAGTEPEPGSRRKRRRLDVPHTFQKKGSAECGLACVWMVEKYFGIDVSIPRLRREIPVTERGTYAPQLGLHLLQSGLDVEIVTMNPWLFTTADVGIGPPEMRARITQWRDRLSLRDEEGRLGAEYFIRFLDCGGTIRVQIPDEEYIRESLNAGSPLISLMTTCFLFGEVDFNLHFTVVVGYDPTERALLVHDPWRDYGGGPHRSLRVAEFLYGLHASSFHSADDGCLVRVSRPKKLKSGPRDSS